MRLFQTTAALGTFALLALLFPATITAADDIVLADFEGKDYGDWKVEGEAFGAGPARGTLPHQKPVTGFLGQGLVNTFIHGDRSSGRLTSPQFTVERKYITFLIGGGGWKGKTCINLLVDGRVVRTATGPHTEPGGSEELAPCAWDVSEFRGRAARVEIVDDHTTRWGHINVDQVVMTDTTPPPSPPANTGTPVEEESETAADREPGELLYNGIQLPKRWPPRFKAKDEQEALRPRPVPYLDQPPAVIPIDVGRQLFVDDFLIEKTDLTRTFHYPKKYSGNPILKPESPLELNGGKRPCATLFNDGVWFDPQDQRFKIWYHAGWFDGTGYATSKDGLHWERPELDVVPGTNRILPAEGHGTRDGCAVWLDHFTSDPQQRFKMFLFERPEATIGGQVFTSPDGIHWSAPTRTDRVGDNTTVLYNPFRKKWVYSVRNHLYGRSRGYREHDDLVAGAHWKPDELVQWARTDTLDRPDAEILALMPTAEEIRRQAEASGTDFESLLKKTRFNYGDPPQLYNLDAVAYESLMLGVFAIHTGPSNEICSKLKRPKRTDLTLAYSRDGFHWHRPDRTRFLACTQKPGDWERAYLHSAATVCTIVGDAIYFYYGAFSGESPALGADMYAGGGTGVAMLRRDGFVSMDASESGGTLTTRPVLFQGKHLLVNLDAPQGELRVEVLDEQGAPIAPYTAANCVPVHCDRTRQGVAWTGIADLSPLAGRKVKFRFTLRSGKLYAFWVTPDADGASYGYVAAGGPGFAGPRDVPQKRVARP